MRQNRNGGSSTDLWTLIGRWSALSVHACTYPRLRFISQVDQSEKTMYKSQLKAVVPDADEKEQYFKVSTLIIAFSFYHNPNGYAAGQVDSRSRSC